MAKDSSDSASSGSSTPPPAPSRPIPPQLVAFGVVLVLLIVFFAQNSSKVHVSYLGLDGHMSLAIAMIISALAGSALTVIGQWVVSYRRRHSGKRT